MKRKIREDLVPALLETAVTAIGLATCDGTTVAGAEATGSGLAHRLMDEKDSSSHEKIE